MLDTETYLLLETNATVEVLKTGQEYWREIEELSEAVCVPPVLWRAEDTSPSGQSSPW